MLWVQPLSLQYVENDYIFLYVQSNQIYEMNETTEKNILFIHDEEDF